jgi:hypothetical protein
VVVDAGGGDIGVAKPLLDLGDVGLVVEGVGDLLSRINAARGRTGTVIDRQREMPDTSTKNNGIRSQ